MNLSDRNSRLVLVGTGIGFFGFIINKVIEGVKSSFSEIYINSFPIGVGHFLTTILFANVIAILGLGICYCYFELHNYGNYESEEKTKNLTKADKYYRLLLKFSYTSFFMILLFSFILIAIVPIVTYDVFISKIVTLSLFMLIIIITIIRWKKNWFKKVFSKLKGVKKYSIHAVILSIWIVTLPSSMIFGLNSNFNTEFKINFKHDKIPQIELSFNDHVPDKMPEIITVTLGKPTGIEEIKLNRYDFIGSLTEVTELDNKNIPLFKKTDDKSLILISKSNYTFKKTLTFEQLVGVEKGYIEIRFDTFATSKGKRSYLIRNEFISINGKLSFNQDQFKVDLK